jgi:NitT/TauT family transport system permease protein
MRNRLLERILPWLVVAGLFLIWEIACVALEIPEFVLPRPSVVLRVLFESAGPIWFHASHTLFTTVVGFALAVVGGMLLGVFVGSSPLVYNGLYPVLIGFNSIPKVALVPVLVVWFGIGTVPAVLTAFLISFFPIAVNVATGLATLEPELEDVLRSLGAKRRDILVNTTVEFPFVIE